MTLHIMHTVREFKLYHYLGLPLGKDNSCESDKD